MTMRTLKHSQDHKGTREFPLYRALEQSHKAYVPSNYLPSDIFRFAWNLKLPRVIQTLLVLRLVTLVAYAFDILNWVRPMFRFIRVGEILYFARALKSVF
jgi:hypothetical protein